MVIFCTVHKIICCIDSTNKARSKKSHNLDIKRTNTSAIHLSKNLSYSFDKYLVKSKLNSKLTVNCHKINFLYEILAMHIFKL